MYYWKTNPKLKEKFKETVKDKEVGKCMDNSKELMI